MCVRTAVDGGVDVEQRQWVGRFWAVQSKRLCCHVHVVKLAGKGEVGSGLPYLTFDHSRHSSDTSLHALSDSPPTQTGVGRQ